MRIESLINRTPLNRSQLNNISGQKRHRSSNQSQVFKTLPINSNSPVDDHALKRKSNSLWTSKKPLTVNTIFSDSDAGSTAPSVDSDYASLSVTPAASDYTSSDGPSNEYQCCVWDFRTTHIGAFMKKHRLRNLKKRLDSLGSTKQLPIYDSDIGKIPSQKTTKRTKYNPYQESFVADISHRSRRCVIFRKRRHTRAFGPVSDGMLQKVQVPVDASHNEPRATYTTEGFHLVQADALKHGLTRADIAALSECSVAEAAEDTLIKINRLPHSVADFQLNVADGKFWTQLNCRLWNKNDDGSRKDENNRHLSAPPIVVLRKEDFSYILSVLEFKCFEAIHNMLLDVLNVPNQAETDNDAFCEICQSETSDRSDPIVFCGSCGLCVHQNCFGITIVPKKDDWYCKVCATYGKKTDVRCRFCPLSWGVLKTTSDQGWGHFACSVWQQALRFEDLTKFEPISFARDYDELTAELFNKICSVCDLCYGSCITCSVPNCKIPFHPTCGLRAGLYMLVEDNSKSKIGVKLFSFCAYHSAKARTVRGNTNNRMEFILDQLNMGTNNFGTECYKKSKIAKLENSFEQFVSWTKISDELGLSREVMEPIYNHWVKRRRSNHNRPLISPYEANDKFIALRFRDDNPPKPSKKSQIVNPTTEDMEEMVSEYAKAHCILDKCRNLATLTLRREKLKLQTVMILKEAFDEITAHLEEDSHLSNRFMEKIALSLQDQIFGLGKGNLVASRSSSSTSDDSFQTEEVPRKRGRTSEVSKLKSPKSRRTASFSRPFNKVQELFAELFDMDETLSETAFKSIPADCL